METEEPNPHLRDVVPGSWDVPFKKWVFGSALALLFLFGGLEDFLTASGTMPVLEGRARVSLAGSSGLEWRTLEGAGARWCGLLQIGVALWLHGRYWWRFHPTRWRHHEFVLNGGLGLAAVSLVVTYWYLWRHLL